MYVSLCNDLCLYHKKSFIIGYSKIIFPTILVITIMATIYQVCMICKHNAKCIPHNKTYKLGTIISILHKRKQGSE